MKSVELSLLSKHKTSLMGFSAIYIVLFHISTIFPSSIFKILFGLGNVGVDIFLVLSGIGIYSSLTKQKQNLTDFFKKRFSRLYPPYLIVSTPFIIYLLYNGSISIFQFIFRFFGISIFFEKAWFWYMTIAILCYLLSPILKVIVEKEKIIVSTILIFVVCYLLSYIFQTSEIMWTRIPMFYVGMIFGKLLKEGKRISFNSILGFVMFFVVALFCYRTANKGLFGYKSYLTLRLSLNVLAIPLALFVAYIIDYFNGFVKRFFDFFGNISFELYLVHLIIIKHFFGNVENLIVYTVIIFSLSIPIAYIIRLICKKING